MHSYKNNETSFCVFAFLGKRKKGRLLRLPVSQRDEIPQFQEWNVFTESIVEKWVNRKVFVFYFFSFFSSSVYNIIMYHPQTQPFSFLFLSAGLYKRLSLVFDLVSRHDLAQ